MAKIEYVINADMERIYPKTHEDAILTTDGYTLKQKFEMINEALNNKANVDHKHDFSDLKNIPDSFKCDGGDADTVMGRTVDDTAITTDNLWTADHIHNLLESIRMDMIEYDDIIYYGVTEPINTDKEYILWVNTDSGNIKYHYNNQWIQSASGLQFKYDNE